MEKKEMKVKNEKTEHRKQGVCDVMEETGLSWCFMIYN